MSQLVQTANAPKTETVYCVALEGDTVGGVDWFREETQRTGQPRNKAHVWFDLDVPASSTQSAITELADQAAWDKWYRDDRADCRLTGPLQLFNVTLDWEPGDDEQGDYATSVWAVDEDDAIRRVAEEMADSGEVEHDTNEERAAYIERVIEGAGQYAAERVQDALIRDLGNFLKDRPDALKAIKAILDGEQVVATKDISPEIKSPNVPSSKEMGPMTDAQYIAIKGVRCPSCGSSDVTGSHLEVDAGTAFQPMTCSECGANWSDSYVLTGYANLEGGIDFEAVETVVEDVRSRGKMYGFSVDSGAQAREVVSESCEVLDIDLRETEVTIAVSKLMS